jgi:hypothetical protein
VGGAAILVLLRVSDCGRTDWHPLAQNGTVDPHSLTNLAAKHFGDTFFLEVARKQIVQRVFWRQGDGFDKSVLGNLERATVLFPFHRELPLNERAIPTPFRVQLLPPSG